MVQIALKRVAANPAASSKLPILPFEDDGLEVARRIIHAWPGYAPTPLRLLSDLAAELGLGEIYYKDESMRFGLGSFKPLGGAYAVARCLMKQCGKALGDVEPDLFSPAAQEISKTITVTAATDGNHGRSVAWGARMFGCRCVIFVSASVTQERKNAIAAFGAEIRDVDGSFDDAVRKAAQTAAEQGWHVIPDTSDGQIVEAPRNVTQGYMLLVDEALDQLRNSPPVTHVFLQAGVGGLAAASCARFWMSYGADKPRMVLVEPDQCACWLESLSVGEPVAITGDIDSAMAGLACGEVSMISWPVLQTGADAMLTVTDEAVPEMMRYLAEPGNDDRPVVAGETGISGLAGLVAAAQHPPTRKKLQLDEQAHVFVVGSEGATDPEAYRRIVGRTAEKVLSQ
jgi:diaminopropionate ammonia-lyase